MINLFIVGLFLYFFYPEKRKLILNSTPHIDLTLKNRFKKDKVPDNLDVIIIGSGSTDYDRCNMQHSVRSRTDCHASRSLTSIFTMQT